MKRKLRAKAFNTIFTSVFISFNVFIYLFATRVTPPDIDYFVNDTIEKTDTLVTAVNKKREEIKQIRETKKALKIAAAEETEREETTIKTEETKLSDTTAESDNTDDRMILQSDTLSLVYYSQTDPRWNDEIYGTDNTIGVYGCGPTALAMVLSTLTDTATTPVDAAKWSYDNGHFSNNSGSYHSIIPKGAEKHGLSCKSLESPTKQTLIDELSNGNLIVVLMSKGTFATEGHFLILRGITEDSQVLIADPKSLENSQVPWDIDLILNEAKYSANHGGPFWSISKP